MPRDINEEMSVTETLPLGSTDVRVSPLGIGTWQWGDTFFWGYGKGEYTDDDLRASFHASVEAGINFFDSAEFYGLGRSETLLGQFARQVSGPLVLATKYMPYPWRLRAGSLMQALRRSLARLGMERIDLYQIHWPFPPMPIEQWVNALADAVRAGLARAAGVSNYSTDQMRRAYEVLSRRGVPLASNQVRYNLLHRAPERNGLLQACRELGVTLIAYSPLAQGILTGKYTPNHLPPGVHRRGFDRQLLARIEPLLSLMREIGQARGGKTPSQVALNWVMCQGAIPIPGAKNVRQAQENIGALGWRLTADEVAALDAASARIIPEP